MKITIALVIVGLLLFFVLPTNANDEADGIVVVHQKSCVDDKVERKQVWRCPEKNIIYSTKRFRADYDKQTVLTVDDNSFMPVHALLNCIVLNAKNWYCHNSDFSAMQTMTHGKYIETISGRDPLAGDVQMDDLEWRRHNWSMMLR